MAEVQESLVGSGALPEVSASLPPYLKICCIRAQICREAWLILGGWGVFNTRWVKGSNRISGFRATHPISCCIGLR